MGAGEAQITVVVRGGEGSHTARLRGGCAGETEIDIEGHLAVGTTVNRRANMNAARIMKLSLLLRGEVQKAN